MRKVMGGGGWRKKFTQGKMPRKKIHAKKKVKKKNSCGRKVRKSEFQKSTTRHNMNKQFLALKEAQQNADQRYTYAIGPFCSQWQVSIFDPSHTVIFRELL